MEIFKYLPAIGPSKGLLSIPHSGMTIPSDLAPYLCHNQHELDRDVDQHVHHLVDLEKLQKNGIHILVAHLHRTAIDLNRAPELCVLNWKENTQGYLLVEKNPTPEQNTYFQQKYHRPYFELIDQIHHQMSAQGQLFNAVDLHSMPSKATAYHLKQNPGQEAERPDFCLSDFKGTSCEPAFIQHIQKSLQKFYPQVNINNPYIGGHLTQYMAKFKKNNIQIEINRHLYMDEETYLMKEEQSQHLKNVLTSTLLDLFENYSSARP